MLSWFDRSVDFGGSVFFRGALPPRPENLAALERLGVRARPVEGRPGAHWCLELEHQTWGRATASALRDGPMPPPTLLDLDPGLSEEDRHLARQAGCLVAVEHVGSRRHLLRDRKHALRFLAAVMGDDGTIAADHTSARFWSRAALDDELCHDADVDIEALYTLHLVRPDGDGAPAHWLHSHGLGEIGFFDFDILDPHEEVARCGDLMRAVAFAIVEGALELDGGPFRLAHPGGDVRFVAARRVLADLPAGEHQAWRDGLDDSHLDRHGVACESGGGLVSRLLGRRGPRPVRFLSRPLPDNPTMAFSTAASDLMAERARASFTVFASLLEELREIDARPLVKLGYAVDGGDEGSREHLWFEVHAVTGEGVEATLLNEPYSIARMHAGDRATHPVALLSDWVILTPVGAVSPRQLGPARVAREHRAEILEALHRQADGEAGVHPAS